MTPKTLLAEVEPLTDAARTRRMVEIGRLVASDPEIAATLRALEGGDWYERWLSLRSCFGSRDGAHVVRAVSDPSRLIRNLAVSLAPLVCDDEQARTALDAVPRAELGGLVQGLRARRRFVPLDSYLAGLAERGDDRFPALLPYGSTVLVTRSWEGVADRADAVAWQRLARLHPDLAGDAAPRQIDPDPSHEGRLAWLADAALPELVRQRPDAALRFVSALRGSLPIARIDLGRLAGRRPAAVADLVLAGTERALVSFARVVHRLDDGRVRALIERREGGLDSPADWLHRLPPERRAALFATYGRGWRDENGAVDERLIALLPTAPRQAEARRTLALPALIREDLRRFTIAAMLPWGEARAVLAAPLGDPDPQRRVEALIALVGAVRFNRDRVGDLLAFLDARRNEQDPVRGAGLRAVSNLPPGLWREEHLLGLGAVVRAALDAADLSPASASAAELIAVRLVPFHPERAAEWLATIVRERRTLSTWALDTHWSDRDAERVAVRLVPVLEDWLGGERDGELVATAERLGRRLRVLPGLVAILQRVVLPTRDPGLLDRGLTMLYRHRPAEVAMVVPVMIAADPSFIRRGVVLNHLHRRRQDLLTPFLSAPTTPGRFDAGKSRYAIGLTSGFARWTATQQTIFARMLEEMTGDPVKDPTSASFAVARLAKLPAVPPAKLVELAAVDNPAPAVRDLALRALGGLDGPEGAAALLDALGDDRARIAIYALRRTLLAMPAAEALALLRGVSRVKVTVAKEVVRLTGELRTDEAFADLLAFDAVPQHRDVRVALLRAFWNFVERDETWAILERGAADPDPAIVVGLAQLPVAGRPPAVQARFVRLLAILLTHPSARVRQATIWRCGGLPIPDLERVLLPGLFAALGSPVPDEREAAADAVFATYIGRDAPLVAAAITDLLDDPRALRMAIDRLRYGARLRGDRLVPTVRAVMVALAGDPLAITMRAELALDALPAAEVAELLVAFADNGLLHAEAVMAMVDGLVEEGLRFVWFEQVIPVYRRHRRVPGAARQRYRGALDSVHLRPAHRFGAEDLAGLETTLAATADPGLRRIALAALVAESWDANGWTDPRLTRLDAFRADPAPLVAAAARFVFPPDP